MYDSDASSDEEGDQSFPEPGFHDDEGGKEGSSTLLDGDFLEFTGGRPLPLTDRAKAAFHMSILNVSTQKSHTFLRRSVFLNKYPVIFMETGHPIFIYDQRSRLLNIGWN